MQIDDMRSNAGLLQRYIGTAYDEIRAIYLHLADLLELLEWYRTHPNSADASFLYEQVTPSDTWVIEHSLGKFVSVTYIEDMEGTVDYVDINNIIISSI